MTPSVICQLISLLGFQPNIVWPSNSLIHRAEISPDVNRLCGSVSPALSLASRGTEPAMIPQRVAATKAERRLNRRHILSRSVWRTTKKNHGLRGYAWRGRRRQPKLSHRSNTDETRIKTRNLNRRKQRAQRRMPILCFLCYLLLVRLSSLF